MKRMNQIIEYWLELKKDQQICIRINEVAAALKKMKRHKAPGLLGLVAEMIQSTGDIGTQWILDLCNGIVKEDCIPEAGSQVWYYQFTKGKAIQWSVDVTEKLNCWNML